MDRDLKEVVGVLMRVLGGGEVTQDELADLSFDAEGELQIALNEAYIKLLEFACDNELRRHDPALDRAMRAPLQACLDRIVSVSDQDSRASAERAGH